MATKEQERKALEQIRKIVAGLGEESYIGKAFEGAFEDAESNIDNDFWNSWKERCEYQATVQDRAQEQITEKCREIKGLKERAEKAEEIANNKIKSADNWCAKYHEANEIATKNWNAFREQEDKVAELEQQIIKLKAKLYDMMMMAAE